MLFVELRVPACDGSIADMSLDISVLVPAEIQNHLESYIVIVIARWWRRGRVCGREGREEGEEGAIMRSSTVHLFSTHHAGSARRAVSAQDRDTEREEGPRTHWWTQCPVAKHFSLKSISSKKSLFFTLTVLVESSHFFEYKNHLFL